MKATLQIRVRKSIYEKEYIEIKTYIIEGENEDDIVYKASCRFSNYPYTLNFHRKPKIIKDVWDEI